MAQNEIRLSLVIPTFNESAGIAETLTAACHYLGQGPDGWEIIVSDDGSRDGTADIVAQQVAARPDRLRLIKNRHHGKGRAVRQGMLAARGQYVFFADADLATPLAEMGPMLEKLKSGYDCVIGSRALPGSRILIAQPGYRSGAGKTFNWLVRHFLDLDIQDTQCGCKGFARQAAQEIFRRQRLDGFAFDVEALALAKKAGYRMLEVPVAWSDRATTRLNIWRDPLKMGWELLRIKWSVR